MWINAVPMFGKFKRSVCIEQVISEQKNGNNDTENRRSHRMCPGTIIRLQSRSQARDSLTDCTTNLGVRYGWELSGSSFENSPQHQDNIYWRCIEGVWCRSKARTKLQQAKLPNPVVVDEEWTSYSGRTSTNGSITLRPVIRANYQLKNRTIIETKCTVRFGTQVRASEAHCPKLGILNNRINLHRSQYH